MCCVNAEDSYAPGYDLIRDDGTDETRRGALNLIGTAVSCADDSANNETECTITGGGNSFSTIDVPAGTDPVASSSSDTLTFTETTFLTITGTAATDTIAFTQVTTDIGTDGLIAADAVALGTDTTNAYVATVADDGTSTVTVVGSGAETGAVTLKVIDVSCTNCLTTTEVASADLATLASTVTVVDGTDATSFPAIFDSATGDLAIKTDGGLLYAADTGTLSSTALTSGAGTFSGLLTGNASLNIANGATSSGVLKILEDTDAGSNFATFQVPALTADTVYILPADDGDADQVLSTNGTGTLDWVTGGAGPWTTTSNVINNSTAGDTVTIGSATALGKLAVDGDADEIQLLIQNHSTQTSNAVVFENSAGTDQFALTNAGNGTLAGTLTVGGTAQSTITEGLVVNNGSGTDEDDDLTVNVSGGAYEIDAGAGTFTSTANSFGWSVVAGADTACTTTCTSACVFGVNTASLTADIVDCADATADECLCAGAS